MPNFWVTLFIAYYIVGLIRFYKEVRATPKNEPAMQMFNRQLEEASTASFIWTGIKLTVVLVFIHIPCWILRV